MAISEKAQQLKRLYRFNVSVLCVLILLYAAVMLVSNLSAFMMMVAVVLFGFHLLVGLVDVVEQGIQRLAPEKIRQYRWYQMLLKINLIGLSPRLVSVVMTMVGVLLLVVLTGSLMLPVIGRQVSAFANDLPRYYGRVESQVRTLANIELDAEFFRALMVRQAAEDFSAAEQSGFERTQALQRLVEVSTESVKNEDKADTDKPSLKTPAVSKPTNPSDKKNTALGEMVKFVQNYASSALMNVVGLVTNSVTTFIYSITALVLLFYLLLDGTLLSKGFIGLLPDSTQSSVEKVLGDTHWLYRNLLKVQVVFAVVMGLVLYGLYGLLNVQYAGFLSFFFAMAALIPVLGPWIGATPSALVLLFSNQPERLVVIFVVLVGCYLLKEYAINPRVFARIPRIHPMMLIVSLLIGLQLLGPLGFLLGIALACLLSGLLPVPEAE